MVRAKLPKEVYCAFTFELKREVISEAVFKFFDLQKPVFINVKTFYCAPHQVPVVCVFID